MQHAQMAQIQQLRTDTKTLISSLLEAAKDKETFESVLLPMKQIPEMPSTPELSPRKVKAKQHPLLNRSVYTPSKSVTHIKSTPKQIKDIKKRIQLKVTKPKQNIDILNQEDEFFEDLNRFRKLFPQQFTREMYYRAKIDRATTRGSWNDHLEITPVKLWQLAALWIRLIPQFFVSRLLISDRLFQG